MVDTKQSPFNMTTETVSSWIFPMTKTNYTMQDWIKVNFGGQVSILPCKENFSTRNDGVVKVSVDSDDPTKGPPRTIESICKTALIKSGPYIDFSQYDIPKTGKIGPKKLGILFLWHQGSVFDPKSIPSSSLYSGEESGISVKILSPNGSVMKVRIDL